MNEQKKLPSEAATSTEQKPNNIQLDNSTSSKDRQEKQEKNTLNQEFFENLYELARSCIDSSDDPKGYLLEVCKRYDLEENAKVFKYVFFAIDYLQGKVQKNENRK